MVVHEAKHVSGPRHVETIRNVIVYIEPRSDGEFRIVLRLE
jgi:hypothetical protein